MTDKLSEAIEMIEAYLDGQSPTKISHVDLALERITRAARAYHALAMVDVETLRYPGNDDYHTYGKGWNECWKSLRAKYPDGLRWAE